MNFSKKELIYILIVGIIILALIMGWMDLGDTDKLRDIYRVGRIFSRLT